MPKAWLTIPSARPIAEVNACTARWKAQGYGVALWRNAPDVYPEMVLTPTDGGAFGLKCDMLILRMKYPGYAVAANTLIRHVFEKDAEAQWCIAAGDDTTPDPNKRADEIERECEIYFTRQNYKSNGGRVIGCAATFGVMQCTADRFAGGSIDRIAGSPWIGREFARRM